MLHIQHWIDWLIRNLKSHPDFGDSTMINELFVKITFAIESGLRQSLIKVENNIGEKYIFD